MKKTIIVNISGIVFNIDEDAYIKLSNYLNAINARFNSTDGQEIIDDVEARIAEIFQEKISADRQVISISDVETMMKIMGTPEDYSIDEDEKEKEEINSHSNQCQTKSVRRFYRDGDNRILGGVCSGISAYFDIDPVILRVIFCLSFIFFGSGLIIYLILWISMPEALTTAQKLEMRGERVNVSNIERSIKDEFEKVNTNLRKIRKRTNFVAFGKALEDIAKLFGRIILIFARGISFLFGIVFIIIGLALITGLFAILFGSAKFGNHSVDIDFFYNIIASPFYINLLIVGLFLIIGIPVIYLIYAGVKILFRLKTSLRYISLVALALWLIGIGIVTISSLKIASLFKEEVVKTEVFTLSESKAKLLYLGIDESKLIEDNDVKIRFDRRGLITIRQDKLLRGFPEIDVERSLTGKTELVIKYIASEQDRKSAMELARKINYKWIQNDSILLFDPYFSIPENGKWRNQAVEIILRIPQETIIRLDANLQNYLDNIQNPDDYSSWEMSGNTWIMRQNGLIKLGDDLQEIPQNKTIEEDDLEKMKKELKDELRKELKRIKK